MLLYLLADNAVGSVKKRFLSEIEIMKKLSKGHNPHVVAMKGCVTTQEPLCLITELVEFGDLLSYLRNIKNVCSKIRHARHESNTLVLVFIST